MTWKAEESSIGTSCDAEMNLVSDRDVDSISITVRTGIENGKYEDPKEFIEGMDVCREHCLDLEDGQFLEYVELRADEFYEGTARHEGTSLPTQRELAVTLTIQAVRKGAVCDTGAFSLWVDNAFCRQFGGILHADAHGAAAVDGSELAVSGTGHLSFTLWGCHFDKYHVRVMENLPSVILIGRQFWMKNKAVLDLQSMRGTMLVDGRDHSGALHLVDRTFGEEVKAVIEDVDVDDAIKSMELSEFADDSGLQEQLRSVLWMHREIFKGLGNIRGFEHEIKRRANAEPVCLPIRRRPPKEMSAEKDMVKKMVSLGVLEPSYSPWAAANVFVPKRDGTLRGTSDFRALNAQKICASYPMEGLKETLDCLGSKKVFSTFDLKDGNFQVQLNEASRPLTAVRTVSGL